MLALIVATYWFASSVTQPLFGALAEDLGLRLVGAVGVLMAALFLSLIGVAPVLFLVFVLLVVGGMGSAALHPVGMTIAGGPTVRNRSLGVGSFTAGGMIGFALGPVLILYLVSRFASRRHPVAHWSRASCLPRSSTSCSPSGSRTAGARSAPSSRLSSSAARSAFSPSRAALPASPS